VSNDLTRRGFLGRASLYGSGFSLAMVTGLPLALEAASKSSAPESLTQTQWCTVEAMTGRLIPTGDTPGAIEANCVNFIDKALAHEEHAALGMVQQGLEALNQHCRDIRQKDFCELTPEQQDAVLMKLEDGNITGWPEGGVHSAQFFGLIRALTIMGFLADPKYGGNRGFAGWQVAGYPGPRHHQGGYSDAQMMGEETIRPVWDKK